MDLNVRERSVKAAVLGDVFFAPDTVSLVEENQSFLCSICFMVPGEPVQCGRPGGCAALFCMACLTFAFKAQHSNGVRSCCPVCRFNLKVSQGVPGLRAMLIKNEVIMKLPSHCIMKSFSPRIIQGVESLKSCNWIGPVDTLALHLKTCPCAVLSCENFPCTKAFQRIDLEQHKRECKFKSTIFSDCSWTVPSGLFEEHKEICEGRTRKCICGASMPQRDLMEHRIYCPRSRIRCCFEEFGCRIWCAPKQMEQHLSHKSHAKMLKRNFTSFKAAGDVRDEESKGIVAKPKTSLLPDSFNWDISDSAAKISSTRNSSETFFSSSFVVDSYTLHIEADLTAGSLLRVFLVLDRVESGTTDGDSQMDLSGWQLRCGSKSCEVPPESKICKGTAYGWPLYIPEASALIVNDCITLSVSADLSVDRRERFVQQGRESLLAVQQDCVTAAVGMERDFYTTAKPKLGPALAAAAAVPAKRRVVFSIPKIEMPLLQWHIEGKAEPESRQELRRGVLKKVANVLLELPLDTWDSTSDFQAKLLQVELFIYMSAESSDEYGDEAVIRQRISDVKTNH